VGDTRVKSIKVTVMSKKGRQCFLEKIGVIPSVTAPNDTNPSDATAKNVHNRYTKRQRIPTCQDKSAFSQCQDPIANSSASMTHRAAVNCTCMSPEVTTGYKMHAFTNGRALD